MHSIKGLGESSEFVCHILTPKGVIQPQVSSVFRPKQNRKNSNTTRLLPFSKDARNSLSQWNEVKQSPSSNCFSFLLFAEHHPTIFLETRLLRQQQYTIFYLHPTAEIGCLFVRKVSFWLLILFPLLRSPMKLKEKRVKYGFHGY